jgi:diguanylate cyclase
MMGAGAQCFEAVSHAPSDRRSDPLPFLRKSRPAPASPSESRRTMNALLLFRSHIATAYALAVVFLAALALSALRISIPGMSPVFEFLLFGWLGVALGRLTLGRAAAAPSAARAEDAAKSDRIDAILRSIAKLLLTQESDSDAFAERLNGASSRLTQQLDAGSVREIVMALIEDNREMRDKLSNVRDQLESSRLQVLQLRNNLERAEEAGMRDVVTLIGNRRYFDMTFAEELERARKTGDSFCLALADLDRFKLVNDRFGHLVGDRILRLFAEILVQNVRGQDRVARFGGEEFALMLPGASLEDATTAVERIRKVLESKQWTLGPTGERVGTITASFGLAQLRASETGSDLIKRVDDRLYEAKAKGRNCVVADVSQPAPARAGRPKRDANG